MTTQLAPPLPTSWLQPSLKVWRLLGPMLPLWTLLVLRTQEPTTPTWIVFLLKLTQEALRPTSSTLVAPLLTFRATKWPSQKTTCGTAAWPCQRPPQRLTVKLHSTSPTVWWSRDTTSPTTFLMMAPVRASKWPSRLPPSYSSPPTMAPLPWPPTLPLSSLPSPLSSTERDKRLLGGVATTPSRWLALITTEESQKIRYLFAFLLPRKLSLCSVLASEEKENHIS